MAYPTYLREKARAMRRERQYTIDELAERLSLPRSTIYYRVRDMPIPGSGPGGGFSSTARRKAALVNTSRARKLREAAYEEAREMYPALVVNPSFRDFLCLYLAEGSKRDRTRVAVCNSDPAILIVCQKWIRTFSRRPIRYSVQFHADQDLDRLRTFWGETLHIEGGAIAFQRKSNSNQPDRPRLAQPIRSPQYLCLRHLFPCSASAWMDLLRDEWG